MKKTKKTILYIIIAVLIFIIAAGAIILFGVVGIDKKVSYSESEKANNNINTGVTVVDESTTYQTLNGFGASACWWSQDVGKWENSKEILSYLYDSDKGIGLNIYRYNLGAGSKGDSHILTENRSTEGFLNDDGSYDFTADADAQKCLKEAKELAGDDLRVTLFCNSAPVQLTKNGAGYCSPSKDENAPWESNLAPENYESFADYCYSCAVHFLDEGYRVTDVSPINEPQYNWQAWYNDDGTYSVNQEGCYYSKTEARDLLNVFVDKFDGSDVDEKGCKVSMFESGAIEGDDSTCAAYMDCILGKGPKYVFKNKKLRNYFDTVNMHSYWSDKATKENAENYFSDKYSKYSIACTEYCQMTTDESTGVFDLISAEENGTNGMTIEYGVAMAKVIVDDLTVMNATEWDWWLGCSYGTYTDGLVYLNPDDHSDIQASKRLWCLGNFSKFIDEGAIRLACSSGVDGLDSCAFANLDGTNVIVYVNDTDNDLSTTYDCQSDYEIYTTSADCDLEMTSKGGKGTAEITVPSMSVVTVVVK
ncbi:MAG: glycoside hydrolase [Eubacterium sp.]